MQRFVYVHSTRFVDTVNGNVGTFIFPYVGFTPKNSQSESVTGEIPVNQSN